MSSMNQGFVTAFARRDQTRQSDAHRPQDLGGSQDLRGTAAAESEPGSLRLHPSVCDTAQVWVDAACDLQHGRKDAAQDDLPRPHIQPQADPQPNAQTPGLESLQHTHIALASTYPVTPAIPAADPIVTEDSSPQGEVESGRLDAAANFVQQRSSASAPAEAPRAFTEARVVERRAVSEPWPPQQSPATDVTRLRVDELESRGGTPHIGGSHSMRPFDAAWEVDVFDIPPCVADLFFEGLLFQQITDHMSEAVASGLRSLLVTSCKSREGRTSAAIGLAMAAGAAGIRVALVDADTETPTLADDLRLDLQYGWVDTIRGGLPIKEVAVNAIEDGVTLIPLMPPHGRTGATPDELERLIELLANKFELIIMDGPSGGSQILQPLASSVDSAIIVRDVRRTDTIAVNEFSYHLRASQISGVGVVENFV